MAPVPRSLAVLATIPGREAALEGALASLRPQVEQLRVICHDVTAPPPCVLRLADTWLCEPDTRGSAAKLHWAREWTGLYLGCDDDFLYPPDYVATMERWVKRWKGRALVTVHGRLFDRRIVDYTKHSLRATPLGANRGAWINFPGAAGIAWDTRLKVPDTVPEKNQEEFYLALWGQRQRIPIWLIPKKDEWLRWLLPKDNPGPTIYAAERSGGYEVRQRLMAAHKGAWRLYRAA